MNITALGEKTEKTREVMHDAAVLYHRELANAITVGISRNLGPLLRAAALCGRLERG